MKLKRKKAKPFEKSKLLTIDELINEALISGMRYDEIYEATWGEVIAFVDAYRERKRREYQNLSVIAEKEAYMTAIYLSGKGEDIKTYNVFPYWTEDEIGELTVQNYKNMMLKNSE